MSDVFVDIEEMTVFLGGHLRLVERVEGAGASQLILIRGGPGVGKTILATHMATVIAEAIDANVAYACVEILPSELAAQQRALSASHGWSVVLPPEWGEPGEKRILAVALDLGDRQDVPTTRAMFEEQIVEVLHSARESSDKEVRVLVVDSVSADYGLGGPSVPRYFVDSIAKFAAAEGIVIIVIEETYELTPSPWSFASDTVIELDGTPTTDGRRRIRLAKNRFGLATNAFGEFNIAFGIGPMIYAPLSAYVRAGAGKILRRDARSRMSPGAWPTELRSLDVPARDRGALVLVQGQYDAVRTERLARWVAMGDSSNLLVELHYGRPRGVPISSGADDSSEFAVPAGVVPSSPEVTLDAFRLTFNRAVRQGDIAGVLLVAPSDRAIEVHEFLRVLDALAALCVDLGIPLICSAVRFGDEDDQIVSLLRRAASLNISWFESSPAPGRKELYLSCQTRRGLVQVAVPRLDEL